MKDWPAMLHNIINLVVLFSWSAVRMQCYMQWPRLELASSFSSKPVMNYFFLKLTFLFLLAMWGEQSTSYFCLSCEAVIVVFFGSSHLLIRQYQGIRVVVSQYLLIDVFCPPPRMDKNNITWLLGFLTWWLCSAVSCLSVAALSRECSVALLDFFAGNCSLLQHENRLFITVFVRWKTKIMSANRLKCSLSWIKCYVTYMALIHSYKQSCDMCTLTTH